MRRRRDETYSKETPPDDDLFELRGSFLCTVRIVSRARARAPVYTHRLPVRSGRPLYGLCIIIVGYYRHHYCRSVYNGVHVLADRVHHHHNAPSPCT